MATSERDAGIVKKVARVRYVVVVAVAVVICMLVVFAAPGTTLPRTALRAQRTASAIMATLQAAASIVAASIPPELKSAQPRGPYILQEETRSTNILVLSCALIC